MSIKLFSVVENICKIYVLSFFFIVSTVFPLSTLMLIISFIRGDFTKTRGKPRPLGRGWIAFDFEGL